MIADELNTNRERLYIDFGGKFGDEEGLYEDGVQEHH
jgi:hypothetical protein